MKKLLSLLVFMLCAVSSAWADDVFSYTFNGGQATSDPEGFFSYDKSGKWSFNKKFTGAVYDGVTYSNGLKMEGSTKILFTTTAVSDIEIVQSTWSASTIKFDDTELSVDDASEETGCRVYQLSGVKAGPHNITRGSGESGLFLVRVTYTGSTMQQLDAPEITFDAESGVVTIGTVNNATKVTYTLDGSDPTADSEEYTEPFTAEDGMTVKAIAVGDEQSYINSTVASQLITLVNATIAAPVISQLNGTVALSCETVGVTMEYSLDGTNYQPYTRAFTLEEDATVYARASRGSNESEVSSADVATIPMGNATKTVWMGYGSFDNNTTNSMTGSAGDQAEGFTLTISGNAEKNWSSGGAQITVGDVSRTAIKLSNGAQNTLTLPEGFSATRITIYSFINSPEARTCYWKEFQGEDYSADVPMGAWNTVEDRLTNPDVRVFPLNGNETEITFTNAGEQLCFIIAIDGTDNRELTPVVKTDKSELTLTNSAYKASAEATFTLTGNNMADGNYTVNMPAVNGLTISPESFTVSGGSVSQEFTVTYEASADDNGTADITIGEGEAQVSVTVNYSARFSPYEQAMVTEATTWDWEKLMTKDDVIQLNEETSPTNKEEYLLANLDGYQNLAFNEDFTIEQAQQLVLKGQYVINKRKFQNGTIKFTTTVPGTVVVDFSDTGSGVNPDATPRYLLVNGLNTGYWTCRPTTEDEADKKSDRKQSGEVLVPAGDVTISGTQALCIYSVTFTPAEAPTSITAEIGEAGYATFSSMFEVEIPDGVTAFYASSNDDTSVTLSEIEGGYIPAGTGVVLKGAEGTYIMNVSNTGAVLDDTNLLKANITDMTPVEEDYYTLAAGPVFKFSTGGILAAGKAYLVAQSNGARLINVVFGDATAISELANATTTDNAVYNMKGIRVNKPAKGLYIQNGKKLILR